GEPELVEQLDHFTTRTGVARRLGPVLREDAPPRGPGRDRVLARRLARTLDVPGQARGEPGVLRALSAAGVVESGIQPGGPPPTLGVCPLAYGDAGFNQRVEVLA